MPDAASHDVIVIGAGPAGEVAAGRLAEHGKRVAIVEDDLVGGECSFYACMPSKALLRPQEILREIERIPGAREAVTGELDPEAVLRRRDEVVHDLDDSSQLPWLEDRGIELVRGHGRLDGERRVIVGERSLLAAEAVILACGSAAAVPPIPGLREADPWTNRQVTTASEVPGELIILGGGVVGVEMAQAYASLGSRVTLVEGLHRLLAKEEDFACEQVAAALTADGVTLHIGTKGERVERTADGRYRLHLDDATTVEGDRLLAAVGRRPHTDDLGLDTVGLEPGAYVDTDESLRVGEHAWLYAIGDVNGRALLTHMGKYQARIAADNILGRDARLRSDGALSPRVTFTDPQVAAVGHTSRTAEEAGLSVRCIDLETEGTAGASFYGRGGEGTTRFVIDTDRDVLAGATFVGPDVTDFLHAATIAVAGEVPLERIAHAVPSFPTRSELWLRMTEAYGL